MKKLTRNQERFMLGLMCFGCVVIGLVLGYMLAMWGVYEMLSHIQIENLVIDLNETKLVEASIDYMNRTGKLV